MLSILARTNVHVIIVVVVVLLAYRIHAQNLTKQYDIIKDSMSYSCFKCPIANNNNVKLWLAVLNGTENRLCISGRKVSHNHPSLNNLNYECKPNVLCMIDYQEFYPIEYKCSDGSIYGNVFVNFYVPSTYLKLDVDGDEGQRFAKSLVINENQVLRIKCASKTTLPPSDITVKVGNRTLTPTRQDILKSDVDIRINYYEINATRDLRSSEITCESRMRGVTEAIAQKLNIKHRMTERLELDVHYLPKCVKGRMFNTGLNQSTVIECEGFDANPNVTQYSLKGPLATTEITRIFGMDNKFTVVPRRHQDFGVYECYMRNEAGGKTCEIELRLGGRPNPPTNCAISYNRNSNKTAAQINCKIGYNQGGSISEFIVYERLNDGLLRHSGSVSIHDSTQTDFGYLTKEIDEHAYYEFVVMQRNNYGNSTEVLVSIGTKPQEQRQLFTNEIVKIIGIVAGIVGALVILCVCCCCCANVDMKLTCITNLCKKKGKNTDSSSSYKKYPDGFIRETQDDDDPKQNNLIYKPMLSDYHNNMDNKANHNDQMIDENIYQLNYTGDSNKFLLYDKVNTPVNKTSRNTCDDSDDLTNSFRNELNTKLLKQRNNIENQINSTIEQAKQPNTANKPVNISLPSTSPSYELTTSSSTTSSNASNASNADLIDHKPHVLSTSKQKPPILKPKPRLPNNLYEPCTDRSPSTSVTDISTSNLTSQQQQQRDNGDDDSGKYATIARNGTLSRMSQRPTHAPPPQPSLVSQTTTFYPYISTNYDYAVVNLNQVTDTLRKQNKIKQSDC